ncbi:hypothetical protein [Richelia intracellularis]|nr:hypothetical protein [Richelia intracellularis]
MNSEIESRKTHKNIKVIMIIAIQKRKTVISIDQLRFTRKPQIIS